MKVVWRRFSRPCVPLVGGGAALLRHIAVCFDGRLRGHDTAGRVWEGGNCGIGCCAWRLASELPRDVIDITCAAGLLYVLRRDRSIWFLSGDEGLLRAGHAGEALSIGGTEDITLDFPILWKLHPDGSLWVDRSGAPGNSWRRAGRRPGASRIAVARERVFAFTTDGSLWLRRPGASPAWANLGPMDRPRDLAAAEHGQSGALHLYSLNQDRSLSGGAVVGECRVSLATQNQYAEDAFASLDVGALGVSTNDVWTMSGSALRARNNMSIPDFDRFTKDPAAIERALSNYLDKHPTLRTDTTNLIIVDIEGRFHPAGLGRYGPSDFSTIVRGLVLRLSILRGRFRRAKLSLYGVTVPDSRGRDIPSRLDALRRAVGKGLLDSLDFVTPVLYLAWGPSDPHFERSSAVTQRAIEDTLRITDKPQVPVLSPKIGRRGLHHDFEYVDSRVANCQLVQLQNHPAVERVVYWVKPKFGGRNPLAYVPPEEIRNFFERLEPCGG